VRVVVVVVVEEEEEVDVVDVNCDMIYDLKVFDFCILKI